jgi:hypothetical protein
MADSAAKRRKTSPTTFTPVDAPATPSRIPVPIPQQDATKTSARRPSFASPTKASLSRHNPQLLNRPTSSGSGSERPVSRGRTLQDVFAKALGEAPPAVGQSTSTGAEISSRSASTTQENEPEVMARFATQTPVKATTPKRSTKPIGGGLSTKPRRLSRSPIKRPERQQSRVPDVDPTKDLPTDFNPFQKKGLRRSPVPGQAALPIQQEDQVALEGVTDPFRKTGLRRSPISSSQPVDRLEPPQNETPASIQTVPKISPIPPQAVAEEPPQPQIEAPANISTTPTEPAPTKVGVAEVLREEPLVQPDEPRQPDPSLVADESLHSLGPPRPSIGQGMADLFMTTRSEPPEPELPPTPAQRGIPDPIVTTPPIGIHNTPSKRARRNKALSEKPKSSPSKPKDPPPQQPSKEKEPELLEETKKPQPEPVKRRKSARFLIPEDPHAAKKKARDDLWKELQQLQADVALANQENERLRRAEYKKSTSAASNPDELLAMLTRATAPERPLQSKPKPKSIFKSIGAFLPFHPRRRPASLPVSEKPVPSHLPIALDDPLPYLQAFTPLTYSSTITLLPKDPVASDESSQEREPILQQKHFITASHHSGLFTTRFAMTVDTSTLSTSAIDILRLDMNAEKELGTFIRGRARDEGPLGKDVTVICWAMSRWTEVSIKRAHFWCAVEQEFGTSEARTKSLQTKKKRKRLGSIIDNEDNPAITINDEHKVPQWTRKQLLPHFGRSSMELSSDEVELRFEWRISFDWTGEAESSIAAMARVPKHCKYLISVYQYRNTNKTQGKKQMSEAV